MSHNISFGANSQVNLVKSNMQKIYGRDLELGRQIDDVIEKGGKGSGRKPTGSTEEKEETSEHLENAKRALATASTATGMNKQRLLDEAEIHMEKHRASLKKGLEKAEVSTPLNDEDLNDRLEKGQIADMFVYGYGRDSKPMIFVKTGKEIKEKIPTVIASLSAPLLQLGMAQKFLSDKIGQAPDAVYTYDNRSMSCYSDALCYPDQKTDITELCREYNRLNYNIAGIQSDIDALNVIGNNLEDNKKYELSVSQLIALKFQ